MSIPTSAIRFKISFDMFEGCCRSLAQASTAHHDDARKVAALRLTFTLLLVYGQADHHHLQVLTQEHARVRSTKISTDETYHAEAASHTFITEDVRGTWSGSLRLIGDSKIDCSASLAPFCPQSARAI